MTNLIQTGAERVVETASGDFYAFIKDWFKKIDFKGNKCVSYIKALQPICNTIQVMGMSKPIQLTSIYVALRAYPELRKHVNPNPKKSELISFINPLGSGDHVYDVESAIKAIGYGSLTSAERTTTDDESQDLILTDRSPKRATTLQGIDVFNYINANSKIAVLGQPGSGKTTFLKTLALLYSGLYKLKESSQVEPKIPIYIRLRDYSSATTIKPDAKWFKSVVIESVNSVVSEDISTAFFKLVVASTVKFMPLFLAAYPRVPDSN